MTMCWRWENWRTTTRGASSGERGNNEEQFYQKYGGCMRALDRGKEKCRILARAERWGSSAHRGGGNRGRGGFGGPSHKAVLARAPKRLRTAQQ